MMVMLILACGSTHYNECVCLPIGPVSFGVCIGRTEFTSSLRTLQMHNTFGNVCLCVCYLKTLKSAHIHHVVASFGNKAHDLHCPLVANERVSTGCFSLDHMSRTTWNHLTNSCGRTCRCSTSLPALL